MYLSDEISIKRFLDDYSEITTDNNTIPVRKLIQDFKCIILSHMYLDIPYKYLKKKKTRIFRY